MDSHTSHIRMYQPPTPPHLRLGYGVSRSPNLVLDSKIQLKGAFSTPTSVLPLHLVFVFLLFVSVLRSVVVILPVRPLLDIHRQRFPFPGYIAETWEFFLPTESIEYALTGFYLGVNPSDETARS